MFICPMSGLNILHIQEVRLEKGVCRMFLARTALIIIVH